MRPALVKYFQRKTGNAVEAEDLAQEVIVRTLTSIDWKSQAQAKGYIFRAAVNLLRDRRRRQQARAVVVEWEETAAAEIDARNSPESLLAGQQELHRLVQALRDLEPRARSVLMLVKLENMKIANVAATLGVSIRTVHGDLAKAMARLAQLRNSRD